MNKKSINVSGLDELADKNAQKYAEKKVENLCKYLPRHARKSVSAEVKLEQVNHDHGNKYQAEIIFKVPGKTITAKDSTGNILAAIDIVEKKIQNQLQDYKHASISHISNRGLMAKFKRSFKREL
jgi:putative sigma-54 modulation protein